LKDDIEDDVEDFKKNLEEIKIKDQLFFKERTEKAK
jgi:hypothetical protein